MQNNKGFSIVEVLLGTILFFSMLTTILPISIQIYQEKKSLNDEKLIHHTLYEELKKAQGAQAIIDGEKIQHSIKNKKFSIIMSVEEPYVKACAQWENFRTQKEVCFYDLP